MTTNAGLKFFLLSYKPHGKATAVMGMHMCIVCVMMFVSTINYFFELFFQLENVVLPVVLNVATVRRNNDDYFQVKGKTVKFNLSSFRLNVKYQNVPQTITSLVDTAVNMNWRLIIPLVKPTIIRFASDMIDSILLAFFRTVSRQEISNRPMCGKQ